MSTEDHFINIIIVALTLRANINKWDLLKLRKLCKVKDTVSNTKQQPIEYKKIFSKLTSDRGLISKHRKLKNLDIKMGYRSKLRVLNRRITNDQKTIKELLSLLSHQANENQNDSEISIILYLSE